MSREAMKLALQSIEDGETGHAAQILREALAEQPAQGCEFCSHPLYAGTKCKNCGREQPAQHPKAKAIAECLAVLRPAVKGRFPHEQALEELVGYIAAPQPAQQEPVALFKWLPEGATHIGRISVNTAAGGSLEMSTHAFKYDSAELKVYVTDNDNEYPGWRDAKDCFFHLNFPVLPLYTTPQPAQRTWVGLTEDEVFAVSNTMPYGDRFNFAEAIEAKLRSKNI